MEHFGKLAVLYEVKHSKTLWPTILHQEKWKYKIYVCTNNWTQMSKAVLFKIAKPGNNLNANQQVERAKVVAYSYSSKLFNNKMIQFSSAVQSCPTLCNPMDYSMPGFPVHHQLLEPSQTHVHWVGDAIQPSHPLSFPSPPAFNLSQHQGLFQWVSSSHQVAKVLEFQLQHQSFQWIFRTDPLYKEQVGSPCGPRDSQESSPTTQLKSIKSSALSFLYGPNSHIQTWLLGKP